MCVHNCIFIQRFLKGIRVPDHFDRHRKHICGDAGGGVPTISISGAAASEKGGDEEELVEFLDDSEHSTTTKNPPILKTTPTKTNGGRKAKK